MCDVLQAVHAHGECRRNNQVFVASPVHHFNKWNSSDFIGHLIYSHFPSCRFENMAEQCKKSLEILKLAQNRGLQPPKHHFEERTYRTVRSDTFTADLASRKIPIQCPHLSLFSTKSTYFTSVQHHRQGKDMTFHWITWFIFLDLCSCRIFPELSSTDMVVVIVRGMNLPAPPGKFQTVLETNTQHC